MNSQVTNPPSPRLRRAKKKITKLPGLPGVYLFKKNKKVLYVGKATSLKDRVRSYFNKDIVNTRSPLVSKMLSEFTKIDFIKTDSVLEALILEAKLIKKFQPEANIKEKDNRSFNYVVITDEKFPRVLVMRGRTIEKNFSPHSSKSTDIFLLKNSSCSAQSASQGFSQKDGLKFFSTTYLFGPFPNGSQLKEAIKIVRKMFPFRDKCLPCEEGKKCKACFNRQIGLCPGVCTGEISEKEYAENIKNIVLFFESNKKKLVKNLEKQMKNFAKNREFEKAQKIKKTIFTLNHIQDIALLKEEVSKGTFDTSFRVEAYDVAHMSGKNVVGVMTVVEDGEKKISDYRKFKIKNEANNDIQSLGEVLTRRLSHIEWRFPDMIVVDGGKAQKNIAEKIIKENNLNIPVVAVVKNEYHKPERILGMNYESRIMSHEAKGRNIKELETQILLANAEAHRFAISYHDKLRRKIFGI